MFYFLELSLETYQTIADLKKFNFSSATLHADRAESLLRPISFITFHQLPDIEFWRQSMHVIHDGQQALIIVRAYIPLALQANPDAKNASQKMSTIISQLSSETQSDNALLQKTWLIKIFLPIKYQQQLQQVATALPDIQLLLQNMLNGHHRYMLLFQNSQELRATGGFMGSYSIIEIQDGQIPEISVQDIYQPDGQFHGFVLAPPGLQEYLSSGHGMRLPDANWSPDFPTSAKNTIGFFDAANEKNIDGVIALNLSVAEDVLKIFGDIPLPDYNLTVTPENISSVARSDRNSFFPGSQQKRNFLSSLFTKLKIKMEAAGPSQTAALAVTFLSDIKNKNVQFFSTDDTTQHVFEKYGAAGEVQIPSQHQYIYAVESNVGINKANQYITHEVAIKLEDFRTVITLTLHNQNPSGSGLHYIDYQRLLLPQDAVIRFIQVGNQTLPKWDEDSITTSTGQQVKQIGFLVTVPEQSDQTVTVEFTHPPLHTTHPILFVQKQSGLPPTPYTVTFQDQTRSILLDKDQEIGF